MAVRLDPLEAVRVGWAPPEPADAEFVARVRRNIAEADKGARVAVRIGRRRFSPTARPRRPAPPKPPPPPKPSPPLLPVHESSWEPTSPPVPYVTQASLWPRGKIIAAMWLWAAAHDGRAPRSTDWQLTTDEYPSFNRVVKEFGAWSYGVEAAGFDRPISNRETFWTKLAT